MAVCGRPAPGVPLARCCAERGHRGDYAGACPSAETRAYIRRSSLQPRAHVKTGLPHGGSRVEFGQVLFIPLDCNKERSSLVRKLRMMVSR
jgi:hypothetical protein